MVDSPEVSSSDTVELTVDRVPRATGRNDIQLAMLAALFAGLLSAGAYLGNVELLVAVAVVQAVLIPSWVLGGRLPGRIGALILGVLTAGGADAATMYWHDSGYGPVLGVFGVAIPLMFAHQLTRGVVRTRVVESMSGIAVLLIAVGALSGLIVLRHQGNGETVTLALVASLGAGLVLGHLTDAVLPVPRFDPTVDRGLPAVLVAAVAGGVVGVLTLRDDIDFAGGRAAFVGAAVAVVGCLLSVAATFAESRTTPAGDAPGSDNAAVAGRRAWLRPAAAVALTIALATPAGYVLVNALTS